MPVAEASSIANSACGTDEPLPPHFPTPFRTTLRYLLTYELDISSVPRQSFFEWLAAFSEGDKEEKLRWFCEPAGQVCLLRSADATHLADLVRMTG